MSANNRKDLVMALDAGTGAARCFVTSLDGEIRFDTYQEWQYLFPPEAQPGGMEFDPKQFWLIFVNLIQKMLKNNQIDPNQIKAISSTSQREGFILLDKQGNELYAGPNTDVRWPINGESIARDFGEEIYRVSGHWPLPMFAPYRLLWLKEKKPDLYSRADSMLMINDWILYHLCGEKISEPTNAVETLLFDLTEKNWSWTLIEQLGLPKHLFSEVCPSGTMIGGVTHAAAQETGLIEGTPVVTGGADTHCGVFGSGSLHDGQISTICGTYAQSVMVLDQVIIDDRCRAWSGCYLLPNKWIIESTAMETGQAFRFIRDVFYQSDKVDVYSKMDEDAQKSPPGARGIQSFIGPRVPDYRDLHFESRGGFLLPLPPLSSRSSRKDFCRAVLESVAFGIRANIERLIAISGKQPYTLSICGGMSKSIAFREILANVMNRPIRIAREKEGTALAAAICAAVGSKQFSSFEEGAGQLIEFEDVVIRNDFADLYDDLYQNWLSLMPIMYDKEGLGEIQ